MPVGTPRTKSAHDPRDHDKAHWNAKVPVAHSLPSKVPQSTLNDSTESCPSNIDEVPVLDDPREWSQRRKVGDKNIRSTDMMFIYDSRSSLYLSLSHMRPSRLTQAFLFINVSATLSQASPSTNMLLAAIEYVQRDLNATTNEIALSLSLFILVQGVSPLLWSSVSDIKGRKVIYISSLLVRVFFSQPASDADEF